MDNQKDIKGAQKSAERAENTSEHAENASERAEKVKAWALSMFYHRSRKTRAAFYDAANQVEGEVITLLQLMEPMFELGFLDVSDMRWRTPTKTFRNGR